jgi:Uncharacterised protein family (UPF0175)
MKVTLDLPEDIAAALKSRWTDLSRSSLEAIAVEAYRTGVLNESQVRRMMGFETRYEVHGLLKQHRVPLHITAADVEADVQTHRDLGILPRQ